jgi:hypothetical protein
VRYTHLDEDGSPGLWVLPTGKPNWRALDDRYAEYAFVLVADDPIKTGAATHVRPGPAARPSAAKADTRWARPELSMPWTADRGRRRVRPSSQIPNGGDEDAHAVYTVTGPVPQPRLVLGNGQYVQLAADLGALDRWVVDTAAGTSTVNGVNRYDAWGAGSVFPLIPPGGVELRLRSATGGTDQTAGASVLTAPSWK